jgi:hypothetical protein
LLPVRLGRLLGPAPERIPHSHTYCHLLSPIHSTATLPSLGPLVWPSSVATARSDTGDKSTYRAHKSLWSPQSTSLPAGSFRPTITNSSIIVNRLDIWHYPSIPRGNSLHSFSFYLNFTQFKSPCLSLPSMKALINIDNKTSFSLLTVENLNIASSVFLASLILTFFFLSVYLAQFSPWGPKRSVVAVASPAPTPAQTLPELRDDQVALVRHPRHHDGHGLRSAARPFRRLVARFRADDPAPVRLSLSSLWLPFRGYRVGPRRLGFRRWLQPPRLEAPRKRGSVQRLLA